MLILLALLVWGCAPARLAAGEPPKGRLTIAQPARVVVEELACRCEADSGREADVVLATVGTETLVNGERHFHPIVTVAFDRLLAEDEPGQWVALWNYGVSRAGWRRTLRAFLPIPSRSPRPSQKKLPRLEAELERARAGAYTGALPEPELVADLGRFRPATASHGFVMGLKRALDWVGVVNPAQLLVRTYLLNRADRDARASERAYLGLAWLVDVNFDGDPADAAWLRGVNELRFHLLRNRSFFGRWVRHSDAVEVVYGYDSHVREDLAKGSSWLQADANDYHLRYEPIHRFTTNGATVPMGGILFYDPRNAPAPERARWPTPNVFDLDYNPFTHREIQRRARENPDELIPLALYSFQSELGLRPVIIADFFAPNNPRVRETTQQSMQWLKEWLVVSTNWLSPERFAYRLGLYVTNKKAFTLLVSKSARLGVEEMRLALESHLYFDPAQRPALMWQVDKRVLNPLVKPAAEEAALADLQYEGLRRDGAQAACQLVQRVRRKLAARYHVSLDTPASERWAALRARLAEARARRRLCDVLDRGFQELGGLAALEAPLGYFEHGEARDQASAEVLRALYAVLYQEQVRLPPGPRQEEVAEVAERARTAWARLAAARGLNSAAFDRERARVEAQARAELAKAERKQEKSEVEFLRDFLKDAHKSLKRVGCAQSHVSPAEAEMYLALLVELRPALQANPALAREFRKHQRGLERDLRRLEQMLASCGLDGPDPWRPDVRESTLRLLRAAHDELFPRSSFYANEEE